MSLEASPMLPVNASYNLVFCAPGTTNGSNQLAPGLSVSVIGSTAPAQIIPNYTKFYGFGNECNLPFVLTGVWTQVVQSTTPVALAVTVNSDLYVLPAAFFVVPSGPPTLTNSVSRHGCNSATDFSLFRAPILSPPRRSLSSTALRQLSSARTPTDRLLSPLLPLPGPYTSSVEALNPDGQTSGQANPFGPPQSPYIYSYANQATIAPPVPRWSRPAPTR